MHSYAEAERVRVDNSPAPGSPRPFRPEMRDGSAPAKPAGTETKAADRKGLRRLLRRPLFLLLVVAPNLLSILYFGLIASPVYISSASVMVLSAKQNGPSLSSLLAGASGDSSEQGGYVLKNYFASWDAFRKVDRTLDLGHAYRQGDGVSRYGGLSGFFTANDVALWRYFQKRVDIDIDQKSGIVSLDVEAYDPAYAVRLARALLADALTHMDTMNRQQERDLVASALARKSAAEDQLRRDLSALGEYRRRTGTYDPKELYLSNLSLMNSLALKASDLKAQRDAVAKATPGNPQAQTLSDAVGAVRGDMAETRGGFPAMARSSSNYEKLLVARDTDISLLGQANQALQEAQANAERSHYYLNVISQPSAPMTPERPRRLLWIGAIALISLALWGLLR